MKCCNKDSKDSPQAKVILGRLCYCFKYSEDDFKSALNEGKETELIEEIKSKMKDLGCFCEKANPSGKCCLMDIQKFIEKSK